MLVLNHFNKILVIIYIHNLLQFDNQYTRKRNFKIVTTIASLAFKN
jgi:hypothetical protein